MPLGSPGCKAKSFKAQILFQPLAAQGLSPASELKPGPDKGHGRAQLLPSLETGSVTWAPGSSLGLEISGSTCPATLAFNANVNFCSPPAELLSITNGYILDEVQLLGQESYMWDSKFTYILRT